MIRKIEKQLNETDEFLNMLSQKLNVDKIETFQILRTVLHTLREFITKEESIRLMLYLPTYLKVIYIEEWKINKQNMMIKDLRNFIERVKMNYEKNYATNYTNADELEFASRVIFRTLNDFVVSTENKNLNSILPGSIGHLFNNETTVSY